LALAATVVLIIAAWVAREMTLPTAPLHEESTDALLPPVDRDPEYQFLLSVAALTVYDEDLEEVLDFEPYPELDLSQLTFEEREELRMRLEREMKADENAIS
jgi:hypothetical protein